MFLCSFQDVIDSALALVLFNGEERTFSIPSFSLADGQLQFANGSVALVCSPSHVCEAELLGIVTLGSIVTLRFLSKATLAMLLHDRVIIVLSRVFVEMFTNGTWSGSATLEGGPFAFGDISAVQTFYTTQLPPWLQSTATPLVNWKIADLRLFRKL